MNTWESSGYWAADAERRGEHTTIDYAVNAAFQRGCDERILEGLRDRLLASRFLGIRCWPNPRNSLAVARHEPRRIVMGFGPKGRYG